MVPASVELITVSWDTQYLLYAHYTRLASRFPQSVSPTYWDSL